MACLEMICYHLAITFTHKATILILSDGVQNQLVRRTQHGSNEIDTTTLLSS